MIKSTLLIGLSVFACLVCAQSKQPNFIVIFVDDQGYGDLSSYGSATIKTPALDRMAEEGIRFTNFYVGSSVCSASRASLLTGRYSARHGTRGVYFPGRGGMDPNEITIAEVLKSNGYATACFGKWHLGDDEPYLPRQQGFDEYYGIPYSNDMFIGPRQLFADYAVFREGYDLTQALDDQAFVAEHLGQNRVIKKDRGLADKVPLMEGEEIVEYPADQATLTRRYFDRSIQFIGKQAESGSPFFLYLTPAMPHIPLFASEVFVGQSNGGLYGDTIEEIDWNVGRLLEYLDTSGLSEDTMVVYASDNGPWLGLGDRSGSAGVLRDGKFSNYEGGVRVPGIVRWPGKIRQGYVSDEVVSTIDLLPTIVSYAKIEGPDVVIDGLDISKYLENPELGIERDMFIYLAGGEPIGIRVGEWKYSPVGLTRHERDRKGPELFNLRDDLEESRNVIGEYPEIANELTITLERFKAGL